MKSRDYWKKRYQQLEESTHNKSLKAIKELEPIFDSTLMDIETSISKWYQRIADNNEVSLKEAKRLLRNNELEEFHWTIEKYIKYGKENAINQQWMKELENASARYHITKLEAQKIEVRQKVEKLFNKEYVAINKTLKSGYKDGFYHSCYELEKGLNVGKQITKLDNQTLEKIISKPWTADGNNFSDRIWNSKTDLIDTLHKELTRMYTLGEAPDKAIKNITKKFNVSKAQAGRLVQTEMSYFNALADKDSYKMLGVEKIEIDTTLDSSTCSACGSLDGTIIDLKDYEIGVNIPPYHPNCRCTTVPWFEEEFDEDKRIAMDSNGKQYYVPSTMKYNEWKEKYIVDNKYSSGSGLIGASSLKEIVYETRNIISNTFQERTRGVKLVKTEDNFSKYNSVEDKIYLGSNTNAYDLIHELGHKLQQTFTKEEKELYNKIIKEKFSKYKKSDFRYISSDDNNDKKGYYILKDWSDFVDVYQSRIYENKKSFYFNNVNHNYALEYFSVGIEYYYKNPILLKERDKLLYEFIEMMVKDDER